MAADTAYEFATTPLEELPLPAGYDASRVGELARRIDNLASTRLEALSPKRISEWLEGRPTELELRRKLRSRWVTTDFLREEMVALQEECDWECYALFGFATDAELAPDVAQDFYCPRGDRPFERLMGHTAGVRKAGRTLTSHEATVQTGRALPSHLEALWTNRVEAIQKSRWLRLIETPVFKRAWRDTEQNVAEVDYRSTKDGDDLSGWLLDRLEAWSQSDLSRPFSIREAAQALQHEPAVQAVAEVLTGSSDYDLERVLTDLALTDAVPVIAAQRYSDSGMEKRAAWEHTWDLQRKEDAGETVDIPVPPKYGQPDFRSTTYWQLRGKLDVPKERFVHLPGAERDDDPSPVLLWAGADHLQRALAMAALYQDREAVEGWGGVDNGDRLLPLLVGVAELVPWIKQWHNEPGRGGQRMGEYFAKYVEDEARKLGKSVDDLAKWRPVAKVRKGRGKA